MITGPDVELPASLNEEELVAAVFGQRAAMGRTQAIKELARRGTPRAASLFAQVVRDPTVSPDVRSAAAVALGKAVSPRHETALVEAVRSAEPQVVRRAAEALGRTGGPEALPALQSVPTPGQPAAARALVFARALLAYRHGLAAEWLKPPAGKNLPVEESRAVSLRPEPLSGELERKVASRLTRELPAMKARPESGVHLECAGNRMAVLPTEGAARMLRASSVPAVVLKQAHSLEYYALHLYILSHPLGGGRMALFGMRPDGTLAYSGEARAEGDLLHFRVEALDTQYSPPAVVEGRLEPSGRIAITKALVGRQRAASQRRAKAPQLGRPTPRRTP